MRKTCILIFLLAGIVFMLDSCNSCNRSHRINTINIDLADFAIDSIYAGMAKKVFYSLPTPIEMSILIKNLGIAWNVDLLNDPANASKYLTNHKMALNFGIYITDFTYAGLYDQSQIALRYKIAIQQLIEGLGLQSAINVNTMQLLEDNINDKDMLLRIISDTYASCSTFLQESVRQWLTFSILAGAWVESMYIATNSLDVNLIQNESKIKQLTIDQILSFDMMWKAMSEMKDVPEIDSLMKELSDLAKLFDKIGLLETDNIISFSDDTNVSELSSSNIIILTSEDYEKIKKRIHILRNNFINI